MNTPPPHSSPHPWYIPPWTPLPLTPTSPRVHTSMECQETISITQPCTRSMNTPPPHSPTTLGTHLHEHPSPSPPSPWVHTSMECQETISITQPGSMNTCLMVTINSEKVPNTATIKSPTARFTNNALIGLK